MLVMAVAAILGSFGQILLKVVSGTPFKSMLVDWRTYGFAACYGFAVLLNIVVYRAGMRIAVAYPMIALSYVFSAVLAWWLLGEQVNGWIVTGIVVIVVGVSLIGYGASL